MTGSVDPDWVAVEEGIRPAARITLPHARAAAYASQIADLGLSVVSAARTAQYRGASAAEAVLYVGRSAEAAQAARDAEAPLLTRAESLTLAERGRRTGEVGRALGYPACCVASYVESLASYEGPGGALSGAHEDFVQAGRARLATRSAAAATLNHLLAPSHLRLVTFYPCRYDCPQALALSVAILAALRRRNAAYADRLAVSLGCEIALDRGGARATIVRLGERPIAAWPAPPPDRGDFRPPDAQFARTLCERFARGTGTPEGVCVVDFRGQVG